MYKKNYIVIYKSCKQPEVLLYRGPSRRKAERIYAIFKERNPRLRKVFIRVEVVTITRYHNTGEALYNFPGNKSPAYP